MGKKEKRAKLIAEMREINDKVMAEKRAMTDEERSAYEAKEAEMRQLTAEIEAEERAAELNGFSSELPVNTTGDEGTRNGNKEDAEFRAFLTDGKVEARTDLSVGDGGGALAPKQFVAEVIQGLDDEAPVYAKVRKVPLSAVSGVDVPAMDTDATDAAWTSEIPSPALSADTALKYKKITINPETLAKLILVSKKLIKCSAIPVDQLVRERLQAKIAKAFENGILNGSGANQQPLGVFTASANGVSTARDVTTAGASMAADDFIDMKMKLKPGYRKNAVWVMNTEILKDVMKLKDSHGDYIWQKGFAEGEPDTILGIPVIESTLAPTTKTTGSYVAVLGDFSKYWFTYVDQLEIQVLLEKYADTLQVGYLANILAGGAPVLGEAFARLKIQ